MASHVSTLTMRLIDGVSGVAGKVNRSLRGLDNTARGAAGARGGASGFLAGGGKFVAAIGGYAAVRGVMGAEKAYAAFDRRMTRIGITADAAADDVLKATTAVKGLANDVALPLDDVVDGLDALVAAGRSLPDAMAFLPAVSRTAQAAGAATVDIANSADALASSFKITGDRMQGAFDILVAGGKAGKFELKDMSQYIPSLAPAMAAMGYSGEEGLSKLVAMLQLTRAQTGNASEAATNLANVFQKMESEETVKKFGKFGINLRKELGKAKKEGKDVIEVFLDLTEKATKGDLSKLTQLFTDAQYQKGVRALLTQRDTYKQLMGLLQNAAGSVERDLTRVTNDAASSVERFSNSMSNAVQSMGKLADSAGLSSMLENIAKTADQAATSLDRISNATKKDGWTGGLKATNDVLASDPRSRAFADLIKRNYGVEVPLAEANRHNDPIRTQWWNRMEHWTDDPQVRREAEAWINDHFGRDRYRSTGRATKSPRRPVTIEAVPETGVPGFDYTRRGGLGFSPSGAVPPGFDQGQVWRENLPPMAWVPRWNLVGPRPEQPYESPGPGMPLPRRHPLRAEIEPSDFSKEAAASMESYRTGLQSQMAAAEAEVDAFVGRIQSKLSFSASPRVNVSLAASDASVPATQTKSYQSGQKVADHLRGGHEDYRFS
jgi:TP901 family phage tail tape measure protein